MADGTAPTSDQATKPPAVRRRTMLFAVLAVMLGMLLGVGAFTFGYGKGFSYLSSDPKMCINCHVMQGHYDSWQNSSHRHVAVCNDCHLPHHPIGKWVTKGDNGFFHSLAFTLDNFHEPIQIKERNRRVTQGACIYCHQVGRRDRAGGRHPDGKKDCRRSLSRSHSTALSFADCRNSARRPQWPTINFS